MIPEPNRTTTDHRAEAVRVLGESWDDGLWGEASETLTLALVHAVLDLADAVRGG